MEPETSPPAKRAREEPEERSIPLHLPDFPEWFRKLPDDHVVRFLKLGVRVYQSVTFTVEDMGLEEHFQAATEPLKHQLEALQKTMLRDITVASDPLKQQLGTLQEKIEKEVTQPLTRLQAQLELTPHSKGRVAEQQVWSVLKKNFLSFSITDTSKQSGKGDYRVETTRGHKILIEVKNHKSGNVPQKEVDKFHGDLLSDPQVHVGIFFSMSGGISNKIKTGSQFQVEWSHNQYRIYVCNAGEDETLLVWSVWLADELAATQKASQGDLEPTQVAHLEDLLKELSQSKGIEKTLQKNIKSLEDVTSTVKENLKQLLHIQEQMPKKIKTSLKQ